MIPAASIGLLAAVVTVVIWTSFIVIARASAGLNLLPLDIAWLRIVGASTVLLPWSLWLVRRNRTARTSSSLGGLSPLSWRMTALVGFFGGLLYAVLAYAGFFFAPAAHAAVLMPGSLPLWTTLLAMLLLGERPGPARMLGLACILAGGLLVGGASLLKAFDGGEVWKGDLLFMGAALCWSVYSVLVRRHALDPVHTTMAITAFACVSFVPLYAIGAWQGWVPSQLGHAPVSELLFQAAFQGVGSVVISGITFTLMIRHFGPVRSTMITALVPGLSALGAVAVLGEPLSANLLLGLALVTLGIVFGVRPAPARIAG
ncbi:MAG: DMT family transporter [Hydrogenophaga sp.]|nr:DMT family transporter [Hydrogenophaga sp.]